MSPVDRLAGSRGWVRSDGHVVYDQVADLMMQRSLYPASLDEAGRYNPTCVWTGTNGNGTAGPSPCMDWTTATGPITICSASIPIYCAED